MFIVWYSQWEMNSTSRMELGMHFSMTLEVLVPFISTLRFQKIHFFISMWLLVWMPSSMNFSIRRVMEWNDIIINPNCRIWEDLVVHTHISMLEFLNVTIFWSETNQNMFFFVVPDWRSLHCIGNTTILYFWKSSFWICSMWSQSERKSWMATDKLRYAWNFSNTRTRCCSGQSHWTSTKILLQWLTFSSSPCKFWYISSLTQKLTHF